MSLPRPTSVPACHVDADADESGRVGGYPWVVSVVLTQVSRTGPARDRACIGAHLGR